MKPSEEAEGLRSKEVLLVEDSPGDVRLTREALRDANPHLRLAKRPCECVGAIDLPAQPIGVERALATHR